MTDEGAERYLTLSVNDLMEDVLRDYRINVWPKVEATAASHSAAGSTTGVVLEGSALWPEFVTGLDLDKVTAVWLAADEGVFLQRIHAGSLYRSKSTREQMMIDTLIERTLAYNARMVATANRHRFILVDALQSDVKEVTERRSLSHGRCPSIFRSGARSPTGYAGQGSAGARCRQRLGTQTDIYRGRRLWRSLTCWSM